MCSCSLLTRHSSRVSRPALATPSAYLGRGGGERPREVSCERRAAGGKGRGERTGTERRGQATGWRLGARHDPVRRGAGGAGVWLLPRRLRPPGAAARSARPRTGAALACTFCQSTKWPRGELPGGKRRVTTEEQNVMRSGRGGEKQRPEARLGKREVMAIEGPRLYPRTGGHSHRGRSAGPDRRCRRRARADDWAPLEEGREVGGMAE